MIFELRILLRTLILPPACLLAAGLSIVPAPAEVWAPREIGTMRYVPTASGLLRSYTAVYALAGEGVRDLLVAAHLRSTVR
jgi:hypothetical protein